MNEGQYIHCYYNFHKGTLSLKNPTSGRVESYQDRIILRDAEFRVQPKGRERVLEEGKKNVHAYVAGYLKPSCPEECPIGVRYNPYEDPYFKTVREGEKVETSDWVIIEGDRCYIPES